MSLLLRRLTNIDWVLFLAIIPLLSAGLLTMKGFSGLEGAGGGYYFGRQIIWIFLGFAVFFIFSFIDWRFFKKRLVARFSFGFEFSAFGFTFAFGN